MIADHPAVVGLAARPEERNRIRIEADVFAAQVLHALHQRRVLGDAPRELRILRVQIARVESDLLALRTLVGRHHLGVVAEDVQTWRIGFAVLQHDRHRERLADLL